MTKFEKTKKITSIVFISVWLVFAIIMWVSGLTVFNSTKRTDGAFLAWLLWGVMAAIPMIVTILKGAFDTGKQGARDGANEYTAKAVGNTVYVENHPFRGAIIGFLGGLLGGVAVGPIVLPCLMISNIIKLINHIKDYRAAL